MKKAEKLTGELCNYLSDAVSEMFIATEKEEYEMAAVIRDDIQTKLMNIVDYLITNNLTTLDRDELIVELDSLKWQYIRMWETILDIKEEDRLNNI
jgi:hypothetical protein